MLHGVVGAGGGADGDAGDNVRVVDFMVTVVLMGLVMVACW